MIKFARIILALACGFGIIASGYSNAQTTEERERLLKLVNDVLHDDARHQAAVTAGRERILLCSRCHGEDGNSLTPDVPNLAGQNPTYLLEQIEKFADGRRKNFVMQSLAHSFTMEDKVNIAVYFASMKVTPVKADSALAAEGARIFSTVCQRCHGVDGKGEQGYARLAGQKTQYVIATLKRFRAIAHDQLDQRDIKRSNARMEQVTQNLTDREIEALANYITLLR